MTQILTLTVTQLSGHCRTVLTDELCAVQVGGQGSCRGRLHVIFWEGCIRGEIQSLLIRNLQNNTKCCVIVKLQSTILYIHNHIYIQ